MATVQLGKKKMWQVTLSSKVNLTQLDRDFLAELVSEEAHNASRKYNFVLHDMTESAHYCKLYVEASRTALKNLLVMLKSNVPYKISVTDWGEHKSAE